MCNRRRMCATSCVLYMCNRRRHMFAYIHVCIHMQYRALCIYSCENATEPSVYTHVQTCCVFCANYIYRARCSHIYMALYILMCNHVASYARGHRARLGRHVYSIYTWQLYSYIYYSYMYYMHACLVMLCALYIWYI